ncbi:hypothetical protein ACFWZ3_06955 [Frateuria sp. GZRR35]|uniref:hypothetical protein n=1 Tax=Frateuria sp. GZRR35 TaxID=3351536 RepID=UPI003EDC85D0
MKNLTVACGLVAASLLPVTATPASPASPTTLAPQQVGSTNAVTVEPHLPVPAGEPCVVNLIQDETNSTHYTYMPPPGCRGPWAKVVLKVNVTERGGESSTKADLRLGGFTIYEATLPKSAATSSWEVERDLTDFTVLLEEAHNGQVIIGPDQDIWYNDVPTADEVSLGAQLLFYRATSSHPAPKTPDALYRIPPAPDTLPTLPRNIDRAYLDVYNEQPWWFTCVTDQEAHNSGLPFISSLAMGAEVKTGISSPWEGCDGGSFAEMLVRVDGSAAGIVPVFPVLSANLSWYFGHTINAPAQPPQMINHIPYRLDLTPFSPRLDAAGRHRIELSRPADATLFVYLDKGTTMVSGLVTRNTLNTPAYPLIDDTINRNADTGTATVSTSLDRDYTIEGYMNTSRGRVDLSVHQTSHFLNRQEFYFDGLQYPEYRHYRQHLWLESQTQQHSVRTRAGTVLDDMTLTASYPLEVLWDAAGHVEVGDAPEALPTLESASVDQHWNLDTVHIRNGFAPYTSRVREDFSSSHARDLLTHQDSNWQSQAQYLFDDSLGSCYQAALTTSNGAVATENQGVGCPNGQNHVRWRAHPDGSPDSLGWTH